MNSQVLAVDIAAVIVTLIASVIDVRTTKIPNLLTFPGAALGIIMNFAFFGWQRGLLAIAGWFIGVFLSVVIFNTSGRQLAFGDAKLMAAVGAFLGLKVVIAWMYFAIVYGTYSIVMLGLAFPWKHVGQLVKAASVGTVASMEQESAEKFNAARKKKVPSAPFYAAGTILAVALMKPTMSFLGFPDW
ncbi:MAG TPA: A24 family peptidase [Oculatellaceae cyanobacterium]